MSTLRRKHVGAESGSRDSEVVRPDTHDAAEGPGRAMPVHRVEVSNIIAEVQNRNVVFQVYADEEKMGRLTVSRGGIGWYPSNSPNERRLDWEAFDQLVRTWRG